MRARRVLLGVLSMAGFALVGHFLSRHFPERFDPVVECSRGHRYRSIWVPFGSLKAVRMFGRRFQWCPVGRHWSWTQRVDDAKLSPDELGAANAVHDLRIA